MDILTLALAKKSMPKNKVFYAVSGNDPMYLFKEPPLNFSPEKMREVAVTKDELAEVISKGTSFSILFNETTMLYPTLCEIMPEGYGIVIVYFDPPLEFVTIEYENLEA